MKNHIDYGLLIREYREKKFLTQAELTKDLSVSFATVNRWENGGFEPTLKMKKKLHQLFINEKLIEE